MKRFAMILMAGLVLTAVLPAQTPKIGEMVTTSTGLQVELLKSSEGERPLQGDKVSVHYTGTLVDGTKFDSSLDRNMPFEFMLGRGQVIRGWDEGIAMLKVGEKARFVIPPDLGYGERDMGTIPPNSTLVFEVELLGITPGARPYDVEGKDTVTTPSGLKYIKVSEGEGPKAKSGMRVKVHYTGYLLNGDKFDSSVDRGEPIEIMLGAGQVIQGWDEGISYLSVGDKARIIIPYPLAYGEAGRPPIIPERATLIFDVELVDAVEVPEPKPFDVSGVKKERTPSGLEYYVVKTTEGEPVQLGSTISVHYTGYFESGEIFDSSVQRGQPIELQVGRGQVIQGWDEGLQLLNKGEKARLIIPYHLGYGENGHGPIPPKATLVFDVEIVDVK